MAMLPERTRFQAVVVVDLLTNKQTYKIYRRGTAGNGPPLASGFASKVAADARIKELEREAAEKEMKR